MPVARMAIQFNEGTNDEAEWHVTDKAEYPAFRYGENDEEIPAGAWGQVRKVSYGVDRDYGGINSSGGPQHSGRPEHRLIKVERESDKISPELFKRCCNGMQLRRVVIWDPDYGNSASANNGILIYAEDCHVVSFEGVIFKNPAHEHDIIQGDVGEYFQIESRAKTQGLGDSAHIDLITILYTKISVEVYRSTPHGWNTLNETAFNTNLRPPPADPA